MENLHNALPGRYPAPGALQLIGSNKIFYYRIN
jgi:hypothetical protein